MSDFSVAIPRTIQEPPDTRTFQREQGARNVRRFGGRFRRADFPTDKLNVNEVTQAIAATLANVATKDVAEATGGSVRAAQNVREGMNGMSLTAFLNACRCIPELRALAMEMMGCDAETDPEFVAGITHLMNAYVRKRHAQGGDE